MLGAEGDLKRQAEFTFAVGRHALVHTASIFQKETAEPPNRPLAMAEFSRLCGNIATGRTPLRPEGNVEAELARLRSQIDVRALRRRPGSIFPYGTPPLDPERRECRQLATELMINCMPRSRVVRLPSGELSQSMPPSFTHSSWRRNGWPTLC